MRYATEGKKYWLNNLSYNIFELPKNQGGLGVLPILEQLTACAASWWSRLLKNPSGQWQQIAFYLLHGMLDKPTLNFWWLPDQQNQNGHINHLLGKWQDQISALQSLQLEFLDLSTELIWSAPSY